MFKQNLNNSNREGQCQFLSLRCLFDMYQATPILKPSLETDAGDYASHAIFIQLRFVLSRVIAKQEFEVLYEIERLSKGTGLAGRDTPIAIWISLWTLMLSYEEQMIYLKASMRGLLFLLECGTFLTVIRKRTREICSCSAPLQRHHFDIRCYVQNDVTINT